jgi:hypothetical protein
MGFLVTPLWKGSKERLKIATKYFHLEPFPVLLFRIVWKKIAILMIIAIIKTRNIIRSRGPSTRELKSILHYSPLLDFNHKEMDPLASFCVV